MAEILKRLTQQTTTSFETQYNANLAKGVVDDVPLDYNRPFTFLEWSAANPNANSTIAKKVYEQYLSSWYSNRYDTQTAADLLKSQYQQVVERLQYIFKDDPAFRKLANANLDDPYDVEILIPLLSKKLRDIALYYVGQRANAKKSKIKYNIAGSNAAIERLFYEYILKNYTASTYQTTVIEQSAFAGLPQLSSVKDDFKIVIQELYDTSTYQDKNPSTAYEDITVDFVKDFCATDVEAQPYYNKLGAYDVVIDNPMFFNLADYVQDVANMAASATINLDGIDSNKINEFEATAKYLGTDLYYISGGYYIPKVDTVNLDIKSGSNLFYWPSGEFVYRGLTNAEYSELPINESEFLTKGTAAANYEDADKIFVNRCGYGIQGAWLCKTSEQDREDTFKVELQGSLKCDGRTILRFPFPGRGYFIDDEWTGVQTNGLINKTYFTDAELAKLEDLYWNTSIADVQSSTKPVAINDTYLAADGAQPGSIYNKADHFFVRQTTNPNRIDDETPDGVFNNSVNDYWLFRFEKTELPITASVELSSSIDKENGTHIFWPYESFDGSGEYTPLPTYITRKNKIALPTALSSLNVFKDFGSSKAGTTHLDSDVILKLDNCGEIVGAAYLKGQSLRNFNSTKFNDYVFNNNYLDPFGYTLLSGVIQPGLTLKASPGVVAPFIWGVNGAKFGDINDVPATKINSIAAFTGHKHEPNCPYLRKDLQSLYYYQTEIEHTTACECKALNYSPFGHKGNRLDSFGSLSDFIFEITSPLDFDKFELSEWRDSLGRGWQNSDRIAYFKLDADNKFVDLGWGTGKWMTPGGGEFLLRPGVVYGYYRNNKLPCLVKGSDFYFILNHQYCNPQEYLSIKDELCYSNEFMFDFTPRWIDLVVDNDTNISSWKSRDYTPSDIVFNPGDHLVYIHRKQNTFSIQWDDGDEKTVSYDLINFIWQTKLRGWNYSLNKWTGSQNTVGAKPYWALADELCGIDHFNLSIGNHRKLVNEYLFTNHPKYTLNTLNHFDTIEYFRRANDSFIWTQNFTVSSTQATTEWRKINLVEKEPYIKHNCSVRTETVKKCYGLPDEYTPDDTETNFISQQEVFDKILVIESLSGESDIVFESSSLDQPVSIVYCAKNPFTITQTLTDVSVGLPPSGGVYVPVTSGVLVNAKAPYANLLNINNPTVAYIPNSSGLATKENLGLFTPDNLVVPIYNSSIVAKEPNIDNDYRENVFYVADPTFYIDNRGLSNVDNNQILKIKSTNASFIKYPSTAACKSGDVYNDKNYPNFNAYQSVAESHGNDTISIPFNELTDPWVGEFEDEWFDKINYTANLYGEYNILSGSNSWASSRFNETTAYIHKHQTDIYGNYYTLFKDTPTATLFAKQSNYGRLYVKTINNKTLPAVSALAKVYDTYAASNTSIYRQLTGNKIKNIEVFYDTMISHLSGAILVDRISVDYETGEIFSSAEQKASNTSDNSFVITIDSPTYGTCGSILIPDDNTLTFVTMASSNPPYPKVYEHILGSDIVRLAYDGANDYTTFKAALSSYGTSTIPSFDFAYDKNSGIYTVSYILFTASTLVNAFMTVFINLKKQNGKLVLDSFNLIRPYLSY